MVVAEGYKEESDLESSVEFYEDRGDHIDLYGPSVVDYIVSESGTFHADPDGSKLAAGKGAGTEAVAMH